MCVLVKILTNYAAPISDIIHSRLIYGFPIWGFATKGRLNQLLVKQKLAIRKIYNLPYKEHTLYFFRKISNFTAARAGNIHDFVLYESRTGWTSACP